MASKAFHRPQKHLKKHWRVYIFFSFFFITLLLRLPLVNSFPFHQDSFLYLRGIEKFNVLDQSPHPPGYILYIALGKLITLATADPHLSLIILSLLASSLTTPVTFFLAKAMFKKNSVALATATLILTSPLIWFYGGIALNYSLEALLIPLLIYLLFEAWQKKRWRSLILAVLFLGIIGGIRQSDLVFLFPACFFVASKFGIRKTLLSLLLLFTTCLSWLWPMIYLTGGLNNYWVAITDQGTNAVLFTSIFNQGWRGLLQNLLEFGNHIFSGLRYPLSFTLIITALLKLTTKFKISNIIRESKAEQSIFLLSLWIIPALFFYLFIHVRNGHLMTIIPATIILLSFLVITITEKLRYKFFTYLPQYLTLTIVILIIGTGNILSFLSSPTATASLVNLKTQQRDIQKWQTILPRHFSPQESIILTDLGQEWSKEKAAYYFPQYNVYTIAPGKSIIHPPGKPVERFFQNQKFYSAQVEIDPTIKQLIFFDYCHPQNISILDGLTLLLHYENGCTITTIPLESEQNREIIGKNSCYLFK